MARPPQRRRLRPKMKDNELYRLAQRKLESRGFSKAAKWPELLLAIVDIVKELDEWQQNHEKASRRASSGSR